MLELEDQDHEFINKKLSNAVHNMKRCCLQIAPHCVLLCCMSWTIATSECNRAYMSLNMESRFALGYMSDDKLEHEAAG